MGRNLFKIFKMALNIIDFVNLKKLKGKWK